MMERKQSIIKPSYGLLLESGENSALFASEFMDLLRVSYRDVPASRALNHDAAGATQFRLSQNIGKRLTNAPDLKSGMNPELMIIEEPSARSYCGHA